MASHGYTVDAKSAGPVVKIAIQSHPMKNSLDV